MTEPANGTKYITLSWTTHLLLGIVGTLLLALVTLHVYEVKAADEANKKFIEQVNNDTNDRVDNLEKKIDTLIKIQCATAVDEVKIKLCLATP